MHRYLVAKSPNKLQREFIGFLKRIPQKRLVQFSITKRILSKSCTEEEINKAINGVKQEAKRRGMEK
jgi:hypothetical protein